MKIELFMSKNRRIACNDMFLRRGQKIKIKIKERAETNLSSRSGECSSLREC